MIMDGNGVTFGSHDGFLPNQNKTTIMCFYLN